MLRNMSRSILSLTSLKNLLRPEQVLELRSLQRYSGAPHKKPQELASTFVLLHDENNRVIGTRSLQFAQELATKRKMRLTEIRGPPTKKTWLKLELLKEGFTKDSGPAKQLETKSITVGITIADHDLKTKAKQAAKWISHGIRVRVAICGNVSTQPEQLQEVLKEMQSHLEGVPHQIQRSDVKGGTLRFLITAPTEGAS